MDELSKEQIHDTARKNILANHGDPDDPRQLLQEVSRLHRQQKPAPETVQPHGPNYSKPDPYATAFDFAEYRRDAQKALRERGQNPNDERLLLREMRRMKREQEAKQQPKMEKR